MTHEQLVEQVARAICEAIRIDGSNWKEAAVAAIEVMSVEIRQLRIDNARLRDEAFLKGRQ